ncbi:hypothetical protein C8R45DRAFT_1088525 [Mycena sanguinolenta]|nr:hypothetical protein C8R45DRAFT_1088525 [Mycena sanguinolenta]
MNEVAGWSDAILRSLRSERAQNEDLFMFLLPLFPVLDDFSHQGIFRPTPNIQLDFEPLGDQSKRVHKGSTRTPGSRDGAFSRVLFVVARALKKKEVDADADGCAIVHFSVNAERRGYRKYGGVNEVPRLSHVGRTSSLPSSRTIVIDPRWPSPRYYQHPPQKPFMAACGSPINTRSNSFASARALVHFSEDFASLQPSTIARTATDQLYFPCPGNRCTVDPASTAAVAMSPADLSTLIHGRPAQIHATRDLLQFLHATPGDSCPTKLACALGRNDWHLLDGAHRVAREKFWDDLPGIYSLPPWTVLRAMKDAALREDIV